MVQFLKSLLSMIPECWINGHVWAHDENAPAILGPEYQAQQCTHCNKERHKRL